MLSLTRCRNCIQWTADVGGYLESCIAWPDESLPYWSARSIARSHSRRYMRCAVYRRGGGAMDSSSNFSSRDPEWCRSCSITRDDVVRVGACRDGVNCFADRWYPNLTELLWLENDRTFRVDRDRVSSAGRGIRTYGISRNGFAGKGTGLES